MTGEWIVEWEGATGVRRLAVTGRVSVGRSRECDVVLDDPYVSRLHCTIEPRAQDVLVNAVRPENPILVNGRDYDSVTLHQGAVFYVGNSVLRVLSADGIADAPTLRLTRRPNGAQYVL